MKPLIIDAKDLSDSTEVYNTKPNPFFVYFIYCILGLVVVSLIWMIIFKVDIVVENNGIFRYQEESYQVSSGVTGELKNVYIKEGQYVKKGDVLFTVNVEEIDDEITINEDLLLNVEKRIEILMAYQKSLDKGIAVLEPLVDNPYYQEFYNKRLLLDGNIDATKENTNKQASQYTSNISSLEKSITEYQDQIKNLDKTISAIQEGKQPFDNTQSYYKSILDSYFSNYSVIELQYNNKIDELNNEINQIETKVKELQETPSTSVEQTTIEQKTIEDMPLETEEQTLLNIIESETEDTIKMIQSLLDQKATLEKNKQTVTLEKEKALQDLKLQQIANIEQQKEGINTTLISVESNLVSAKAGLDSVQTSDINETKKLSYLSEKEKISAELLNYENQKKEIENNISIYQKQRKSGEILADANGYISLDNKIQSGGYVQEGNTVCRILPENTSKFFVEIYVDNADIGSVQVNQEVNLEIAAYPTSEYGYLYGTIENISEDIRVDEATGKAYYLVQVACKESSIKGSDGKEKDILNGMACRANIIVEEQNVLRYILEKIDLLG